MGLAMFVTFEVGLLRHRPAEWSLFDWRAVLISLMLGLGMGALKYFHDWEQGGGD